MNDEYTKALEEYKEVGVNWRHWGEIRLRKIVIYLTATAAIAAAAITDKITLDANVKITLCGIGICITVLFAILDERAAYYRRAYLQRAIEIEEILGFWQYRLTNNIYWPWVRSEKVFGLFFICISGAWLFNIQKICLWKTESCVLAWIIFVLISLAGREASIYLHHWASDLDDRRSKYVETKLKDEAKRKLGPKGIIRWSKKIFRLVRR